MHFLKPVILGVVILLFTSCSITDNESFQPAYILLENPTVATSQDEGAPVHDIRDAWVIVDGQLIGVFPLPAKVPVIPTGKSIEVQINAGVKENADRNSSVEYPFFEPIVKSFDIEAGKSYNMPLTFKYKTVAIFDFIEDFESSSHALTFDLDENIDTRIKLSTIDKAYGKQSGLLVLNSENKDAEITTENFFSNDNGQNGNIYLEFDYKSPETIFIGTEVITASAQTAAYKLLLAPTDQWKRAYVNLTGELSGPKIQSYRVLFGASYVLNTTQPSEIFFDNVKLVHF